VITYFVVKAATVIAFAQAYSFESMIIARFVEGLLVIVLTIYLPLYIDSFGTCRQKPGMMAIKKLSITIGKNAGLALAIFSIVNLGSWKYAFYIDAVP